MIIMSIERLKKDFMELSIYGRKSKEELEDYEDLDQDEGITRPLGSEANKKARDHIIELMKDAELEISVDEIGNIFGVKKGKGQGSVLVGSHVDTVNNGGMFDGLLGVLSGIEAVRRLNEEDFKNKRDIEIAVYTGEEGSAIPRGLIGSSVLVDELSLEEAYSLESYDGKTLEDILVEMDYKGDHCKNIDEVDYALELHVEQGPILYEEGVSIGIVKNITGYKWLNVELSGQENHAGTTPMEMRKDALVGASEIIKYVQESINEMVQKGEETVGTVGRLDVHPNTPNVIPGKVEMSIDLRDIDEVNLEDISETIIEKVNSIGRKYGLEVSASLDFEHKTTKLSAEVISVIEESTEKLEIDYKMMNSGAGHDSQKIAKRVKTGMVFVPSVKGISHSPMEWSEWSDIEKGVKVLTGCIKRLSNK